MINEKGMKFKTFYITQINEKMEHQDAESVTGSHALSAGRFHSC